MVCRTTILSFLPLSSAVHDVLSEETDGLAHRRLDVKGLDVLPVLLEQGDEEVDAYECD